MGYLLVHAHVEFRCVALARGVCVCRVVFPMFFLCLPQLVCRYEDMRCDPDMEPFMYGSHYSTTGYVLHFLIRQEPFTSLALDFQSGHFDVADRLFSSVATCWAGCNSSMTDVKELIPEW